MPVLLAAPALAVVLALALKWSAALVVTLPLVMVL